MNQPQITASSSVAPHQPKRVAVLAYDELCTFEYGIAVEIFNTLQPDIAPQYQCETVPVESGMLRLAGGLAAHCVAQCERLAEFDLIIVPGWPLHKSISAELAAALHKAHQSAPAL